jgi:hypothetical protein
MLAFLSFFEELEVDDQPTEEAQPRRRPRMPGRSGGGNGRGPGLQRLLILAGAVLLVVVIAIWQIRSCQRDQEVSAHKSFVSDANAIAKSSTDIGKEFSAAMIQSGQQPDRLLATIESEISKQQQAVTNAEKLDGPGGLGALQPWFLTSMQYRVSGLQGVHDALEQAFSTQNKQDKAVPADQAADVAATFQRLVASDVVYEDSYRQPAVRVLKDKNIDGVSVDGSRFLSDQVLELTSPKAMETVLNATLGGTATSPDSSSNGSNGSTTPTDTTGGQHGLSLEGVSIVPGGGKPAVTLSTDTLNEADGTDTMQLRVVVKNSGDFPESDLTVTAVINDKELQQKITALDAGAQETVNIPFKLEDIDISLETSITVTAEPVAQEANPDNNQKKFRVQFKLS